MDETPPLRERFRSRFAALTPVWPPDPPVLRWSTLLVVVVGAAGYAIALNAFVVPGRSVPWLRHATTDGWPTLLANLFGVVAVSGLLHWRAGFGPADVGVRRSDLGIALAILGGCWVLIQVVGAVALWHRGVPIASWFRPEPGNGFQHGTVALVALLAHVAGVALFEEVVYRGVLFGQLAVRFEAVLGRPLLGHTAAIVAAAAVFAIAHVPHRLRLGTVTGSLEGDLVALFAVGVTFAVVYLRTGSLLLTIGFHGLYNRPTSPVLEPRTARAVLAVLLVAVVIAWPVVERSWWGRRSRFRRARRGP